MFKTIISYIMHPVRLGNVVYQLNNITFFFNSLEVKNLYIAPTLCFMLLDGAAIFREKTECEFNHICFCVQIKMLWPVYLLFATIAFAESEIVKDTGISMY